LDELDALMQQWPAPVKPYKNIYPKPLHRWMRLAPLWGWMTPIPYLVRALDRGC